MKNENSTSDNDHSVHEDPFCKIMEKAGSSGHFQNMYNGIFIVGLSCFGAMIYMNIILALNVPEHWCNVPGRERTNLTLNEWRDLTLPRERNNRKVETFSKCKMYDRNYSDISWAVNSELDASPLNIKECPYGYSYDKTWYERTIPTQEHWVCDKDMYVTNTFVVSRVTEVIGSFVLGQMGDTFGRRVVYYISVVLATIGRSFSIFSTSSFTMFLITSSLVALTVNSLFQSPLIVGMEISGEDDRTNIAMYQSFGWSIGTTLMPLLFWGLRDWVPFMWLTTLPTALVLVFYKYVIESPRWLISKRRYAEALVQFKTIANFNGRTFTITEKELAELYGNLEEEKVFGVASLFNGWRIAKNTMIMGFSWCVVAVSYFTLVLFSSRMGGNPFLNFLLQSVVEIPAYLVGKYLGDKYGRRLTNSVSFLICFMSCIPVVMFSQNPRYEHLTTFIAAFIKFLNAVTFFLVSLQAMEIYPTCLRQTGIALGTILCNAIGVLAPYLVHLGTKYDIRYPYFILGIIFLIGGCSGLFLPETLHNKLPDSLEEAKSFGKNQKFFSLPKPHHQSAEELSAKEKLNQPKFVP
ncbi:carcinine transporter [Eupeodes corollae]|uniref:carcinine transporter n=1 Tax=Eupeodes corollae TaxID=290404 RepID=UPI0024937B62|nr:carcinine transporter [Eupeodes corollae]XP_055905498.1 carcinine transporter [Eupeodes corollae]